MSELRSSKKLDKLRFLWKNRKYIKAFLASRKIKPILTLVNMELAKLDSKDPIYIQRREEFNYVMIELYKAKWNAEKAKVSNFKSDWNKVFKGFQKSKKLGFELLNLLHSGKLTPIEFEKAKLEKKDTEIVFADGVP